MFGASRKGEVPKYLPHLGRSASRTIYSGARQKGSLGRQKEE